VVALMKRAKGDVALPERAHPVGAPSLP
jgi:hypothetical protein